MRVCVFASDYQDLNKLSKDQLIKKVAPSLCTDDVEAAYIATYRMGHEADNVHPLYGQKTFRLSLCRRMFRIIDTFKWIPAWMALIPLSFCKREIQELVTACDPDLVIFSRLRWDSYLKATLGNHCSGWTCWTSVDHPRVGRYEWRKYDPTVKVTIVLPTYNGSKYLRQSIESCLNQTHKNLELIIVDDGSREDIHQMVKTYSDVRVQYVRHPKNLGLPQALNTGFRRATGQYLTWTSDDNFFADHAIEELVRFLQTYDDVDFVYAENVLLNEGNVGETQLRRIQPPASLKNINLIGACFLYLRKVYEGVGQYNAKTFLAEDYDYWIRVSKQFKMQRLLRPLYYYRFHADSLTSKHTLERRLEITEQVKKLNRVPSG